MTPEILLLSGRLMEYAWGTRGAASLAARLSGREDLDANTSYAELWFGAHPKAPAGILGTEWNLQGYIASFS
ncbi:MAG: hypothetical protein KDD44_07630, partial [Bdellovibrionales bacterium]|nr:hypothetical protein [Bdellovibrionales bacterium]